MEASRPEREYGTGPDDHWSLSPARHAVVERKTESRSDTFSKSDIDQLGESLRRDEENHGADVGRVPVLLHPRHVRHGNATALDGTRVTTPADLGGRHLPPRSPR